MAKCAACLSLGVPEKFVVGAQMYEHILTLMMKSDETDWTTIADVFTHNEFGIQRHLETFRPWSGNMQTPVRRARRLFSSS